MANHVRLYVNNKPTELIRSVIERNGTRAVDSGTFTIGRKFAITKGDTFQYVQDVVSPKYLVGLWNMEANTRDESGYDIDGDETAGNTPEGSYSAKAGGYAYRNKTGNSGRCIKITHDSHLAFDGEFDIIILGGLYYGYPNNYTGYLLGKGGSSTSIEIKTSSGSSNSSPMVISAVLTIGGSTTTITGTTDVNKENVTYGSGNMEDFRWIRLKRDENNLVSLMVGNNVEATATVAGDFTTTDPLYIAGDKSGSNPLEDDQYTAQVRIYSGYYLSSSEWTTLMSAKRPTEIMKFGGTVWKIDEKMTHKVCHCKGLSDKLHNITIHTGGVTPTWTTGDADIVKNEYFGKTGKEILEDLISVYNLGINIATPSDDNLITVYSHYHAVGTLLDNITLLCLAGKSDASFHITPRGTLFLEDDDISHTDILFRQSSLSRISNFGYDDTNLVTELTLIGITTPVSGILKNSGNDWASSVTTGYGYAQAYNKLRGKPITVEVTDPDGNALVNLHDTSVASSYDSDPVLYHRILYNGTSGGGVVGEPVPAGTDQFKVDYHDKSIYLGASSSSNSSGGAPFFNGSNRYVIKYIYEDSNDSSKYYTTRTGSFSTLGAYSKTWHVPQFSGKYTLADLASKIFTKLGDLERRVTVTVPTLVNHIRENYKVKVVDPDHNVGSNDSSGQNNDTPVELSVKSIMFLYPEGKTIITCGEHMFDSFDLDKAFSEAIITQKSTIITQPN